MLAFAAAVGVTAVPLPDTPSKTPGEGGAGRPPKQVLYELCQQRWDPRRSPLPPFVATVVGVTPLGDPEAASASRARKQEAEHDAAAKVLPLLDTTVASTSAAVRRRRRR